MTEPGADGLITWELGDMAAGTSRQVTFKVTIDRPAALPDGGIPAVDILNAGAVESARTPFTPSNEVVTPVTEVLGVKVPKPPAGPAEDRRAGAAGPARRHRGPPARARAAAGRGHAASARAAPQRLRSDAAVAPGKFLPGATPRDMPGTGKPGHSAGQT